MLISDSRTVNVPVMVPGEMLGKLVLFSHPQQEVFLSRVNRHTLL